MVENQEVELNATDSACCAGILETAPIHPENPERMPEALQQQR